MEPSDTEKDAEATSMMFDVEAAEEAAEHLRQAHRQPDLPDDLAGRVEEGDAVSREPGLNRMIWGRTYPDVVRVPGKPPANVRVEAIPGTYTARLTVDGESQERSFELRMNPNETWTQADASRTDRSPRPTSAISAAPRSWAKTGSPPSSPSRCRAPAA